MEVKLDEHQLKAVKHFEGPALVVAGPGSGKTTVIKDRILNLIREHNVDPERILAIAFTNTAAEEMQERFRNERLLNHSQPKICTLHVFGKDLITDHPNEAGFNKAPNNIWDTDRIAQIINKEKYRLKRETNTARVAIYKMEGKRTHRCYIGQTTKPERREQEHRTYSSNRGLREALQRGDEKFEFKKITTVDGQYADWKEAEQIEIHRNRAVVILDETIEQIEKETADISVTIYKVKSKSTVTCYFGLSTDLEQSKELHFTESPNDSFRKAIENEDIDISSFKVIAEEKSWADASSRLAREVWAYKKWAVFNDEDPLHARDSTRRRIEVFCEYFDVPYDEVLEHTHKFGHEMRIFNEMKEEIEKEKRQVKSGEFQPHKIADPILRAFATRYEDRKTEARAIDFHDMLILSANMLEKNEDLLQEYRKKFCYVFVDEFQDISPVDFRLIKLFPENLFAVGDDDQAIYGFRGGDSKIMQKNFGGWENLQKYETTCNYRSTSSIVTHAKALIKHNNPDRIGKNLRTDNFSLNQVKVLNTLQENVKEVLLRELSSILSSNFQKVGILARNWKGEINTIQKILNCDELKRQGFDIEWEGFEDSLEDFENEDEKKRRKMFLRHGSKEIEIINIHTAKGREWDKVILLVNTMYNSLPDDRNDLAEERRLFYVAVTRAKHELVILDAGNCQFTSEFQNIPLSERKQQLKKIHSVLLSAFGKRLNDAKEQLQKVSETLPRALNSQRAKPIKVTSQIAQRQHQLELTSLQDVIIEAEKARKDIELELREKLKLAKETFLKKLIPILDQLESVVKNATEKVETKDVPLEFTTFCQNTNSSRKQFLDYLEIYGVRPIETIGKKFNPNLHNVVRSIYSDEVPDGFVIEESKPGYLLDREIFRKALVVVSRGIKPLETKRPTDLFLTQDFTQPVIFATYMGIYYLSNIKSLSEKIIGVDRRGPVVKLKKIDVLFAFPYEDWAQVKPNLTMKTSVKNLKLQPVELVSEKQRFDDRILRSIHVGHNTEKEEAQKHSVQLVTRAGYVLNGCLLDFDRKVLHISMDEKTVIVYRHGILEIKRNAEIESIDTKNSLKVEKESPCPVDSDDIIQTSTTEKDNFGIDTEKHSQILKEQIQKLEIPSERIISPTDEAFVSEKTENEISVKCSVSRLLDPPDNKDDNISEIEEKGSSSLGGQVVKNNFGDYFRQIQDFIRRNLKWK